MNIDLTTLAFISAFIDRKFGLSKNKTLNVIFKYNSSNADGSPTCNVSFDEIINAVKSNTFINFECVDIGGDNDYYTYFSPYSVQIDKTNWSEIIVKGHEVGIPIFIYTPEELSVSLIEVSKL